MIRVGSARADITPPLTIPYLGFIPRQALFEGVHDPLYARAVVFDNGASRVAVLSVDLIGLGNGLLGPGRHLTNELRERIRCRCDVEPGAVMVTATHAHSTPETLGITRLLDVPAAEGWLDRLLDQLADTVAAAASRLVPCTLKFGAGEVLGVAHNRRPGWRDRPLAEQVAAGRLDAQLQVLLCEDEHGNARLVLLNFQCHPVTVQVQPLVSADYPGVATAMVQQNLTGCEDCLFIQGAAGNLNPIRDWTRDYRDVTLYGTMVAGEGLKVVARLLGDAQARMTTTTLAAASARPVIPPRLLLPDRAEHEARLAAACERSRTATDENVVLAAKQQARAAREALDLLDRFSQPQPAEVQVLRVGDLAIASTPGEMFTEWGLRIKAGSAAPHTFVAELANGWVGYLLSPGGFADGGYEPAFGTWTQTSEEGAARLTETAIELTRRLWR